MEKEISNTPEAGGSYMLVAGRIPHDKWLKRFNKSREGKLLALKHELFSLLNNPDTKGTTHKLSYMASALSIATKGTKQENDAKEIIKMLYPDFYKD